MVERIPIGLRCIGRRGALAGLVTAGTSLILPPASAQAPVVLRATPQQTDGPFYPLSWTGDVDHDLVVVTGEAAVAVGPVAHVMGRILDLAGQPIAGARVEIWQCDNFGIYRHPEDERPGRRHDAGFQGYGRVLSDGAGRYAFRTIRPRPYSGRTPHIHFKVERPGGATLTTQLYVFGEAANARDGVLNSIRDRRLRDSVIARFETADAIEPGAVAATFDIVMPGTARK